MKIKGILNHTETYDALEKAEKFISNSKSIEFKVLITIEALDTEYKKFDDDQEFTLTEAAHELKLKDASTLRHAIKKGKFRDGEYRLVGKTYLLMHSAIERYRNEVQGKQGFAVRPQLHKPKKESGDDDKS